MVMLPFSCWQVPAAANPYSRARLISLLNLRSSSAVVLPKEAENGVRVFAVCQLRDPGKTAGTGGPGGEGTIATRNPCCPGII